MSAHNNDEKSNLLNRLGIDCPDLIYLIFVLLVYVLIFVLLFVGAIRSIELITEPTTNSSYDRAAFGTPWADVDHNGCDTRNDILRRDLTNITVRPNTHNCVITSGRLHDKYSGVTIYFTKDKASQVQIDHIVSLKNAWDSGADKWSPELREKFANDPENLVAVEGSLNMSKGSKDASEWMPPENKCWYARQQVHIKNKYGLSSTKAEHFAWAKAC